MLTNNIPAQNVKHQVFLKKLRTEFPYDPTISLQGIYPDMTVIQKDTCSPMSIAALFTIAKTGIQPQCPPTDEWISCIYTVEY